MQFVLVPIHFIYPLSIQQHIILYTYEKYIERFRVYMLLGCTNIYILLWTIFILIVVCLQVYDVIFLSYFFPKEVNLFLCFEMAYASSFYLIIENIYKRYICNWVKCKIVFYFLFIFFVAQMTGNLEKISSNKSISQKIEINFIYWIYLSIFFSI